MVVVNATTICPAIASRFPAVSAASAVPIGINVPRSPRLGPTFTRRREPFSVRRARSLALQDQMLQPAVSELDFSGFLALSLHIANQRPERRRQRRLSCIVGSEQGPMVEPRIEVEAGPLAASGEKLHRAPADHEHRGRHRNPEQHDHRKPEHLGEREEPVLECTEQIQPRLHKV